MTLEDIERLEGLLAKATIGIWTKGFLSINRFPLEEIKSWPANCGPCPKVNYCHQCEKGFTLVQFLPIEAPCNPSNVPWGIHQHIYPTENGIVSVEAKVEVLTTEPAGEYPDDGDRVAISKGDLDLIISLHNAVPQLFVLARAALAASPPNGGSKNE